MLFKEVQEIAAQFAAEHWTHDSPIVRVGVDQDTETGDFFLVVAVLDQADKGKISHEYKGVAVAVIVTDLAGHRALSTTEEQDTSLAGLLSALARIINQFGPDSSEVESFIREHVANHPEFAAVASVSQVLARALTPPRPPAESS